MLLRTSDSGVATTTDQKLPGITIGVKAACFRITSILWPRTRSYEYVVTPSFPFIISVAMAMTSGKRPDVSWPVFPV